MMKDTCLEFKGKVLDDCKNKILEKLNVLEKELKYLAYDIAEETKSSAGDKYETAREMANLEINKLQSQVFNLNKSMTLLNTLPMSDKSEIALGSLIKTNKEWIYLSISLGQLVVNGEKVLVISPNAPLGKIIIGKEEGTNVAFGNKNYIISSYC